MTEQMPKLDVQTLEYVFSILDAKEEEYKLHRYEQMAHGMGMAAFLVKQLIREQREA